MIDQILQLIEHQKVLKEQRKKIRLELVPYDWPLTNTCMEWPAEQTVSSGHFPDLRNPSLESMLTLHQIYKQREITFSTT
jgi:hypothetical protein